LDIDQSYIISANACIFSAALTLQAFFNHVGECDAGQVETQYFASFLPHRETQNEDAKYCVSTKTKVLYQVERMY
jgi:hypothetical protein